MNWLPRAVPLTIGAAIARGNAAPLLAQRLLSMSDDQLARIRGVATSDLIAIAGTELPWVDGIEYLGRDDQLFLPTALAPDVAVPLLARAITLRHPKLQAPIALAAEPELLVSFAAMAPIDRATLANWMERRR